MLGAMGDGDAVFFAAVVTAVPATVAAIAATIGAVNAGKAKRHSRNTDDAVNHRHKDEPRLLDIVKQTSATVGRLEDTLNQHGERLDTIEAYITEPPHKH